MLKNFKKNNNKGFTLVELLVVIAIIGILSVVAVPSLFKNIQKAKTTEAIAYINAAKTAAVSVYADTQTIDASMVIAAIDGKAPTGVKISGATVAAETGSTTPKLKITVTVTDDTLKTALTAQFADDGSVTIQ